jgi:predicted Mrr-cat superfamily restriction endonuclease
MPHAWGIKLGSGGRCVDFCEKHKIVGVGWKNVEANVVRADTRDVVATHLVDRYPNYATKRERGNAAGQIHRFGRVCTIGDYVLYYDPPKKRVRVCRVASDVAFRDFDLEGKDASGSAADVWHYRRVEYPIEPIPVIDFYGALKGRLLGPRSSFWEIRPFAVVDQLAKGLSPNQIAASDPELNEAYRKLESLVVKRAEALDEKDWEWLVADYFKAQGAHVDERRVGGNTAVIDVEARFPRGELGEDVWRVQVKRYQDREIGWEAIEKDLEHAGEDATFCFVSVYGFTKDARTNAAEQEVVLMEAADFTRFLLSGKVRERLRQKLQLPNLDLGADDDAEV